MFVEFDWSDSATKNWHTLERIGEGGSIYHPLTTDGGEVGRGGRREGRKEGGGEGGREGGRRLLIVS